jgi:hypothetical protein
MALDFPANPTDGQVYGSYVYSSTTGVWKAKSQSSTPAVISSTLPATANPGDIWIDSSDGVSYVYYNDGTSSQWIELMSSGVPQLSSKADKTYVDSQNLLKANLDSPTFNGTVTLPSTTSIGPVSSTELGYVDGVTSAIQTQLNNISTTLNKIGSWGAKEGPISIAGAWRNNWQMGQHQGVGIDATSYGDGIMIGETGYYECWAAQRSDGTNIYIGIGINGDRTALEDRTTGIWSHDHAAVSGGWSKSYYIGLLNSGEKVTAGSSGSATGLSYSSAGYAGFLSVKRLR